MKRMIKSIVGILKLYHFNPYMILRFVYYNFFCSNIRICGGFFIPYSNVNIDLHSTAVIELHGSLRIGIPSYNKSIRSSNLIVKEYGRFCVYENCNILEGADIQIHKNGTLTVDDFHANTDLEVSCGNQIRLVGDVSAGRHVRLKDYNGHVVSYSKYPLSQPIVIEDHVWLCTGSCVNPGVHIQSGCVVADNSNVISDITAKCFIQGNPAVVIENDISFKM